MKVELKKSPVVGNKKSECGKQREQKFALSTSEQSYPQGEAY